MRRLPFVSIFAGLTITLAVSVLPAQGPAGGPEFFHGFGRGFDRPDHLAGEAKGPFTATWTDQSVQTLANGTTIKHESTTRMARDSSGKIYEEIHRTAATPANSQPHEVVSYRVHDPVAQTETSWNSETKTATVFHRPAMMEPRPAAHMRPAEDPANSGTGPRAHPDVQREDLGTKTIAGVAAQGTRITHVIPEGRQGNDAPITSTREIWRSTDFGVVLESTESDPRFGTSTRTATAFQPGEPSPTLFHAPEGYTVKDVTRPERVAPLQ